MPRSFLQLVSALLGLAIVGHAQEPVRVTIGTYAFKKPTAVLLQFKPVADALQARLGEVLGAPAIVDIRVTKTYDECLEDFVAGKLDIVRLGPASYVLAKQRNPKIEILVAEKEDATGVGLIVVRDDSPMRKLSDLAGKRFAFGDEQSTIGRFLSQAELAKAGITAKQLAVHRFLERHDIVFKAVELGDFDAGALHQATFADLNAKTPNKLRVLHRFDNVAKPWVARAGMGDELRAAVRKAMLAIDDPEVLKALKVPGFVLTEDSTYDLVREGMQHAESFAPTVKPAPAPGNEPAPTPPQGRGQ